MLIGKDRARLINQFISSELFHLSSPMYAPVSYPSWRENIKAAWVLLNTHYKVQSSRFSKSNTRITVALPRDGNEKEVFFSLTQLKNIAQAVIHFEDALQILMPKGSEQRRNWQDNRSLQKKSRSEAITIIGQRKTLQQLSASFCPESENSWCWHFFQASEVVIVQPGASETAAVVIKTLENLLPFIEACLGIQNARQLESYTPDMAGFKSFMSKPAPSRSLMQRVMRKPDQPLLPPQPCQVPITAVSGPRRRDGRSATQSNVPGRQVVPE
jgi:hypothetical protein